MPYMWYNRSEVIGSVTDRAEREKFPDNFHGLCCFKLPNRNSNNLDWLRVEESEVYNYVLSFCSYERQNSRALQVTVLLINITPCDGNPGSSGFCIHAVNSRFQPGTGFQIICQWNLDSGFQSSVRSGFLELHFRFQTPGFRIPEAKTCGKPIKNFPVSRFRYMGQ